MYMKVTLNLRKDARRWVRGEKFVKQSEEMTWASEHVVGVASDVPEDIKGLTFALTSKASALR